MKSSKILFALTGSIADYKACQVISGLVREGHEVQTVCTPAALKFVGEATLSGLTHRPVFSDMFAPRHMMAHIDLSRWADIAVLCPATANTLSKLAHGLADELVSSLFLAWEREKPWLIAPAMNTRMYEHPATQESLRRLRDFGAIVLPTESGTLACGEEGSGRLLAPERILAEIRKALASRRAAPKGRVLVTSGGTREPIDAVRCIANASTGKTGAALADAFADAGWQVTYVHAQSARLPGRAMERVPFLSFQDLDETLRSQLSGGRFDAVVHAAAVGDFSVERVEGSPCAEDGKLSSGSGLVLTLKPNAKLVERLKDYAGGNLTVVAFKLTASQDEAQRRRSVEKLLASPSVDLVVHNDINELRAAPERHPARIFSRQGLLHSVDDARGIADCLIEAFEKRDGNKTSAAPQGVCA
ncbi:MAG: bifunctional phosphopantothenoylcysteine decarboxylase/phosphopantothenate--cysteine ligase CoaBC [Elusimicrobiota bacterium]|jgi:phosphopantothenoylcysteine decarboxylase/phosphopantothenate--cysteine ligase